MIFAFGLISWAEHLEHKMGRTVENKRKGRRYGMVNLPDFFVDNNSWRDSEYSLGWSKYS